VVVIVNKWRRFGLIMTVVALIVGCLLVMRNRGNGFQFMAGHDRKFSLMTGSNGFVGEAYTWEERYEDVVKRADAEFAGHGVTRHTYKKGRGVTFSRPIGHRLGPFSVDIQPGKTTGKHFRIDGDFIDSTDDPAWVSLQVIRPDPLPAWLRSILP
jgi:hypothetical protein